MPHHHRFTQSTGPAYDDKRRYFPQLGNIFAPVVIIVVRPKAVFYLSAQVILNVEIIVFKVEMYLIL